MGKKILLADDSLTIQKVVELTFSDSDYELTCVSNGRQALEKAGKDRPDLVLADVVMPEKNGYEVCEELKKSPETAGIPVVLLAGTFEPFDRERAERLGCAAIVSKPFDSRALVKKVEALLAPRTADRTPPRAPPAGEPEAPAPAPFAPEAPRDPFDAGFVEEDFTGSIRNLRGGRGRESLEDLYGPEDVESAIAAFREVEPSSAAGAPPPRDRPRATDPVPVETGGRVSRESIVSYLDEAAGAPALSNAERTDRIDVSSFRAARPPAEPSPPDDASTVAIRRDARDLASPPEEPEVSFEIAPSVAPPGTESGEAPAEPPAMPSSLHELSDADVERLAAKVVEKLSERVVRDVAWEVIPEMAELVIRERIKELERGVESDSASAADPGVSAR